MKINFLFFIISTVTVNSNKTRTTPSYIFDGIDLEVHPPSVRLLIEYSSTADCASEYVQCLSALVMPDEVCAINVQSDYYDDFHNVCLVDWDNCKFRNYKNWGFDYMSNRVYYNGEDYTCAHYARRVMEPALFDQFVAEGLNISEIIKRTNTKDAMDKLYFQGSNKEEVLREYEAETRLRLKAMPPATRAPLGGWV